MNKPTQIERMMRTNAQITIALLRMSPSRLKSEEGQQMIARKKHLAKAIHIGQHFAAKQTVTV